MLGRLVEIYLAKPCQPIADVFAKQHPIALRVMLEGKDRNEIEAMATEIVEALKAHLS